MSCYQLRAIPLKGVWGRRLYPFRLLVDYPRAPPDRFLHLREYEVLDIRQPRKKVPHLVGAGIVLQYRPDWHYA